MCIDWSFHEFCTLLCAQEMVGGFWKGVSSLLISEKPFNISEIVEGSGEWETDELVCQTYSVS